MGCVWESLRPGMTVRPCPSITIVHSRALRRISSLVPTALILPSVMATACANDGIPFVAILAWCNIVSGAIGVSFLDQIDSHTERDYSSPSGHLCAAAATGTMYAGNCDAGAPCTIVYAYSTPVPYAP